MALIEYGSKGLMGVLTPQANTTVEPELWGADARPYVDYKRPVDI